MSDPKYKKPAPIIEKIELTKEQQEDIKVILEGTKLKRNLVKLKKLPPTAKMMRTLRTKYFGGLCHICQGLPLYKVTYKMDGAMLVEFYCNEHKGDMDKVCAI